MKRALQAVFVVCVVAGCPDPKTGKLNPYLTARTIINQASLSLPVAEGIFNQWAAQQADVEKRIKAQLKFARVKTAVANGIRLAHHGVNIAEQAREDPNAAKLLAHADAAWKDLYRFLDSLLVSGDSEVVVVVGPRPDSGGPTVGAKKSALSMKGSPLLALPVSLIP